MPATMNVGAFEDALADALALQEKVGALADQAPPQTMLEERASHMLSALEELVEQLDAVLS